MRIARAEPRKARIEIIPMIDTVFFLLVFFMMASLATTVYRGMPVNLPAAASGQPTRDDKAAITLDREGRHRRVVDVVDVARTAGIDRLAVAVVPDEAPRRR